ncbi:MAG: ribonuclease HI [Candidatus Taylorbacteria bacterium RIFCSPHIGHO2_02_FULL_44_36]|uniref:Ribonuclease H n=1 Tax=Candidatus Taylorbacteria bacterium RIFCSPLOWO2_12_FULL_44_15c TaxID=1802333 RepID=A0A1G2P5M0_9BACT|nr:MAG: ribonuclease HI [Candidatus Taylorbacteria bacterium RIFCSPHIGHO2_02_FULL_44_36]OHA38206.1 MAG: ribonuclease HI [Candidatus Taylorbacteria bacterium RIFCSPLOWO2_02_FULL_44_35]OHA43626.1 MAG: ribonuclease HI [Candidatus Taylorbacteria bacterium RIFCSPLOWO2_12_FULL_44_15c]
MNDNEIIIFTDGSSKGNPGPGGWAAMIKISNSQFLISKKEIGGRAEHTTNNRMELTAAIEALSFLDSKGYKLQITSYKIYSDSKYLIDGMTKWIHGWQKNGWRTKDRKGVLNRDLWESLYELTAGKEVEWKYVAGHIGHPENERCDEIAQAFAEGRKPKLL